VLLHEVFDDDQPVSREQAIEAWRADGDFRLAFCRWLASAPFAAFRFETPALDARRLPKSFAFALVDAPELQRPASPAAFAEHFRPAADAPVVDFANLGGDARLIVPCPPAPRHTTDIEPFGHLAAFVRGAPDDVQHRLWQRVARELGRRARTSGPVWLSTAGDGVPWLHVRLDERPKYYRYRPFADSLPAASR
jgi:hypothetical protein